MKPHWSVKLRKLYACSEAVGFAGQHPSLAAAWAKCERGDWMLWLLGKLAGEPGSKKRRELVLTACECARLALRYVPKGEKRPRQAIEMAEAWARGGADAPSLADVRAAAAAAAAYAAYAAADAYAAAAYAAAYAAYAAAAAAAYAAAYAYDADARKKTLRRCANIVRKHYPKPPKL